MAAVLMTPSVAWALAHAGVLSSKKRGLKPTLLRLLSLSTLSLLYTHALPAQAPKLPELGYVYPPVVQIGATTEVTLGGYDWTDDLQWFVHHPQIKLETLGPPGEYILPPPPYWVGLRASLPASPIPREVAGRIACPADAKPGPVYWQVASANGTSSTAVFFLSNGQEIIENRSRDLPQPLPALPVAISGRLSRLTEVDRYQVTAAKDGLISVDLMARQLGSKFQASLEVRDTGGHLIADFADTQGLDGALTFRASAGQTYTVAIHDIDFRGDRSYIYRLALTEGPRAITTLPAHGVRGATQAVEFIGMGLATGAAHEESVVATITFPADANATAHRHSLQTPHGVVTFDIPLSNLPEQAVAALPSPGTEPPLVAVPSAITGRLGADQSEVRFAFDATEKEWYSLTLQSQAIRGSLDVNLTLLDPTGKVILDNDDHGGTLDALARFQATTTGRHTAIVHSFSPRTGAMSEIYRLAIERAAPGFRLMVPQKIDVPLGGKLDLKLQVERLGGFTGPVTVLAQGLSKGVTAKGDWLIPEGKAEVVVPLEAAADAEVTTCQMVFTGSAKVGDTEVSVPATSPLTGNLCPRLPDELHGTACLMTVTMPAPFEIKVIDRERQRDVHRGTTYLAELEIVRQPGFTGDLQIAMTAQQDRTRQGIRGPLMTVPAGATRVFYPCTMPEWLGTELTTRIVVHGVGAVADPQGRKHWLTKAGDARITMILEGALLKLEIPTPQMTAKPGDSLQVPVTISRSVKLPLPTTVELVIPDELRGVIEFDPLVLPPDQSQGLLTIRTKSDARLHGRWTWQLRATSLQEDRWPVVSETSLDVDFE